MAEFLPVTNGSVGAIVGMLYNRAISIYHFSLVFLFILLAFSIFISIVSYRKKHFKTLILFMLITVICALFLFIGYQYPDTYIWKVAYPIGEFYDQIRWFIISYL